MERSHGGFTLEVVALKDGGWQCDWWERGNPANSGTTRADYREEVVRRAKAEIDATSLYSKVFPTDRDCWTCPTCRQRVGVGEEHRHARPQCPSCGDFLFENVVHQCDAEAVYLYQCEKRDRDLASSLITKEEYLRQTQSLRRELEARLLEKVQ